MTEKQRLAALKEPITAEELSEAYAALNEVCPTMDYSAVEMILEELDTYQLPAKDQKIITEFKKHFHKLEWEEMQQTLIG